LAKTPQLRLLEALGGVSRKLDVPVEQVRSCVKKKASLCLANEEWGQLNVVKSMGQVDVQGYT